MASGLKWRRRRADIVCAISGGSCGPGRTCWCSSSSGRPCTPLWTVTWSFEGPEYPPADGKHPWLGDPASHGAISPRKARIVYGLDSEAWEGLQRLVG